MRTTGRRLLIAGLTAALSGPACAQVPGGASNFAADRPAPSAVIRVQANTLPPPAPVGPKTPAPGPGASSPKAGNEPRPSDPKAGTTPKDVLPRSDRKDGQPAATDGPGGGRSATGVEALFGPTLPIDLPTALRLAGSSNPTIASAQVRVREALARAEQAEAARLPTISGGGIYQRHDGIDQNRRADLFRVTRQSVFLGGGLSLRLDLGDAIYQPLAARRLADAEAATARVTTNNTLLDVASAYFDLVQAYAALDVNAAILDQSEQILKVARAGEQAGLLRTAADVNRARTEVALRRIERQDLFGRAGVASARLTRQLLLDPAVTLVPADTAPVPIDLIPADAAVEPLIAQAVANRPELTAAAYLLDAADLRARQARYAPLLPRVQTEFLGGDFAGGRGSALSPYDSRADLSAQLFWELRGLGFGNLADMRLREAERDRAGLVAIAARAQVAAEVVEAYRVMTARRASLDEARVAEREAREMFRKLSETSFGMVGPRGQFDALEPLTAVQSLNQSRLSYLAAVVEYNRAQVRLLTAVGQSVDAAGTCGAR